MDASAKLLAKKERLEKALNDKRKAREAGMVEMLDELSMYDQHPGDIASELYEREKDAGIQENLELELQRVKRALERLDSGTYGQCEACGGAIEPKRLEVLPENRPLYQMR